MHISIIDDEKLILQLYSLALKELSFVNSINIYEDPEKFLSHLSIIPIDVLITDMSMPHLNGLDIITHCRRIKSKKELKIVVISSFKDASTIKKAFDEGTNAFLAKDTSLKELSETLHMISKDPKANYVGESLRNTLIDFQLFQKKQPRLSRREKELLEWICKGNTPKEIAEELGLTVSTVQSYIKQLKIKLEVNRTPNLILKSIELGLFDPKK